MVPTNVTTDSIFIMQSYFRDLMQVGCQIQFIVEIRNIVTQSNEFTLLQGKKRNLVFKSILVKIHKVNFFKGKFSDKVDI